MAATFPPQPFFTLFGSFYHCRFALRCNDIPVCAHDVSGREMHVDMPVNLHLVPGRNVLEVSLAPAVVGGVATPLDHRDVSAALQLAVRTQGVSYEHAQLLGGLSFADGALRGEDAAAPALLAEPSGAPWVAQGPADRLVLRCALTLATPLGPWLWAGATPLTLDASTVSEVIGLYRQFWAAMQAKDGAALRAMSEANALEAQQAFYLPTLDDGHKLLDLEGLARRSSVRLLPMPTEGLRVELLAEGRLARLVGADGHSAIRVVDDETGFGGAVSVMYCKLPARGWVQIR